MAEVVVPRIPMRPSEMKPDFINPIATLIDSKIDKKNINKNFIKFNYK